MMILTSAAGLLFGIIFAEGFRKWRNSKPQILPSNKLRDLQLMGANETIRRIFTITNTKKRVAKAEVEYQKASQNVERSKEKIDSLEAQIMNIKKEIDKVLPEIRAQKSQGDIDVVVQAKVTSRLTELGSHLLKMSTRVNAYRTHLNEERFWDGVREGQSRSRTLNNLIDFEESLLEFNTKSSIMLEKLNNSVKLSSETQDQIHNYWLKEVDLEDVE